MKPTDEQFVQINAIEQECFHGSWTADTLLSELFQIATLPEFRRQGIAERLLTELHSKMQERGAVCCFLEVRSRNAGAIALYEKSGYEKIALRRNYYPDDDAVIYRRPL